jgi:hypothetical protein
MNITMNITLAIPLLLIAFVVFVYAVVTLIRQTGRADVEHQRASAVYNRKL